MDTVKVGQVWRDWDSRDRAATSATARLLVIEKIEGDHAICYQQGHQAEKRRSKIKLERFRPTSTGYKLVTDVV